MSNLKRTAAAGLLCTLLLVAPAPAAAGVTVTVEIVYGGVIGCGLGFFLYFAGAWEVPFAERAPQGVLLELSEGRARLGVPIPSLGLGSDPSGEPAPRDEIRLDLVRWRF
jgi:hypothetical protein